MTIGSECQLAVDIEVSPKLTLLQGTRVRINSILPNGFAVDIIGDTCGHVACHCKQIYLYKNEVA